MCCNHRWLEIVLSIIVFILAVWPALLGSATQWILAVAAVILFIHAIWCKRCACMEGGGMMPKKMPASTGRARKKRR